MQQTHATEISSHPTLQTSYLCFDPNRPPFTDIRVRKALAMAIDKTLLVDDVWHSRVTPAMGGFIPPAMPSHSSNIGLAYNVANAKKLLNEAGYNASKQIPELVWVMHPRQLNVIENLQKQWFKNLGIRFNFQQQSTQSFYTNVSKMVSHLFLLGWIADYPDPDNFLRVAKPWKGIKWHHKTYQQLLEKAASITDQSIRLKLYQQADKILIEEAIIIPLYYGQIHYLVKPWVKGSATSALSHLYFKDVIIKKG